MTQRVDQARTLEAARVRGMADACVLLLASKQLPATLSYRDLTTLVGLSNRDAVEAVERFKDRLRVQRGLPPALATENGRLRQRTKRTAPGPAPDGQKWCGQGAHFVDLSGFSTNRATPDGLQSMCRPCRRDYDRERNARRTVAGL